jgi:hypothetical protein
VLPAPETLGGDTAAEARGLWLRGAGESQFAYVLTRGVKDLLGDSRRRNGSPDAVNNRQQTGGG